MPLSKRTKQNKVLMTYAFIAMTSILLIGLLLSYFYMNRSRIGGMLYDEIMLSNNLTADILPPPEYIIDSYANALEYMNESDYYTRDELYKHIRSLEKIYEDQHSYWEKMLPDYGNLRQVFLVESYDSAKEFYNIFYFRVVPAMNAGDVKAIRIARADLKEAYYEHRNAIDESVVIAEKWRQEVYDTSASLADRSRIVMIVLLVVMIGLSIPIGLFIFRSEISLLDMAYFDGLTGLPNRKQFTDKLESLVSTPNKERFAVVFFDLDGFKGVNDTLGHAAGDLLLKEVTARISALKHADDMLGRFSGDEFALLIDRGLSDDETIEYVRRLKSVVMKLFVIKNTKLALSASFGITFYPDDGDASAVLLKRADKAMYSVKSSGGNGVQFYHKMIKENT